MAFQENLHSLLFETVSRSDFLILGSPFVKFAPVALFLIGGPETHYTSHAHAYGVIPSYPMLSKREAT
jgi:hypothetical protein